MQQGIPELRHRQSDHKLYIQIHHIWKDVGMNKYVHTHILYRTHIRVANVADDVANRGYRKYHSEEETKRVACRSTPVRNRPELTLRCFCLYQCGCLVYSLQHLLGNHEETIVCVMAPLHLAKDL